ncbi:MAG TPA: hypothetical protein VFN45_02295, partial [Myxococcaceae bacterium]|nr:hypothetical protein [Myxococcaceae bacterium]
VVAFVAYWAINQLGAIGDETERRSRPKEVMDRAHEAAKRIERDAEQRVQDTDRKMDEAAR